ncbi:Beta-barrel assembly-enhancing protease [Methylophilaceae bacterium]|nr:Beta-barrel assembly-enhancing protease [Methylophilaceae bacterium]
MKLIYTILLCVLVMPAASANELPDLGDVSATVLSPLQEQAIANQIMRDVMRSNQVVSDPEIVDYIQSLGYRLAANGPEKRQQFNFFVVQDNTINAFAMPGGVIGVHTGLILAANNESELAGVIGHEIGHVVQRHLARMLAQQKQDTILNIASLGLALLAARSNPQLGSGAMAAASAGAVQKQLDYTREHEREADRVGLQILDNAGFDTRGMPDFFNTMLKSSRFVDGSAPSFLRTHPLTTERISDVRNRVESMPYRQVQDSQEFQYVRAKLRAGYGSASQAVVYFQETLRERRYTNEAAEQYGLGLAMMRNNNMEGAAKQVEWLRKNAARHPYIETLAANLLVAQRNSGQAGKLYAQALNQFPNHRALIYGYAEHFLALRQPDKALALIQEKQPAYPDDPYFYELMSQAYTAQGKNMLRHQAQGEAYFRRYNLQGALEQMDLAAKSGDGDFYQQSIVEARLNQLKQMALEPKKEGFFN